MAWCGVAYVVTLTGEVWRTICSRRVGGPQFGAASALLSFRFMKHQSPDTVEAGLQRDPDEWKTGDEPMTAAQRSYLETLSRDAGEEFDETLTKADASKRIDELRKRSPRLAEE